jgi:hypothetical protein
MCREGDVTCTMMVIDFYFRSVSWCHTQQFVFTTSNLLRLHVWVDCIQHKRIHFFASIKVLTESQGAQWITGCDYDINVFVFYSLFWNTYSDVYSAYING